MPKTIKAALLHKFGGLLIIEEMRVKLEGINTVFDDMKKGDISGRIVSGDCGTVAYKIAFLKSN